MRERAFLVSVILPTPSQAFLFYLYVYRVWRHTSWTVAPSTIARLLDSSPVRATRARTEMAQKSAAAAACRVFLTRKEPRILERLLSLKPDLTVVTPQEDGLVPREELLASCSQVRPHGVLCMLTDRIDQSVLEAAGDQLNVVSTMSVGFNHVDVDACRAAGVAVGNTPGVLDVSTAELAVGLLFATARRIPQSCRSVKDGEWGDWNPFEYCGTDVSGSTIGIVGLGRIGLTFAKMMKGFSCKFLYTGPREKPESAAAIDAEFCSMEDMLRRSDIVSVHCPLTPETHHLFNEGTLACMKPSSILINTSRGDVVDQEALYNALSDGTIAAAGIDVTTPEPLPASHPLLGLPNCVVLPHIGSATMRTREAMMDIAITNLLAGIEGRELPHGVA